MERADNRMERERETKRHTERQTKRGDKATSSPSSNIQPTRQIAVSLARWESPTQSFEPALGWTRCRPWEDSLWCPLKALIPVLRRDASFEETLSKLKMLLLQSGNYILVFKRMKPPINPLSGVYPHILHFFVNANVRVRRSVKFLSTWAPGIKSVQIQEEWMCEHSRGSSAGFTATHT